MPFIIDSDASSSGGEHCQWDNNLSKVMAAQEALHLTG